MNLHELEPLIRDYNFSDYLNCLTDLARNTQVGLGWRPMRGYQGGNNSPANKQSLRRHSTNALPRPMARPFMTGKMHLLFMQRGMKHANILIRTRPGRFCNLSVTDQQLSRSL